MDKSISSESSSPSSSAIGYPKWLLSRKSQVPIRALAGHMLEFHVTDFFDSVEEGQEVFWTVDQRRYSGPVLRWIPRSIGLFQVNLNIPNVGRRTLPVQVELSPQDLIQNQDNLDFYFCLISCYQMKLHFIPLIAHDNSQGLRREKLNQEVEQHHPAFVKLMHKQTTIYRRDVFEFFPDLIISVKSVQPGLYAVFPHKLAYLGTNRIVERATRTVINTIENLGTMTTGRASVLREIEESINQVDSANFDYSRAAESPFSGGNQQISSAINRLATRAVTNVVASLAEFGEAAGINFGLGAATSVISFNAATGMFSTRMFDSKLGLWRQVSSGFDLPVGRGSGFAASGAKNLLSRYAQVA
jgi:hypothetical protein